MPCNYEFTPENVKHYNHPQRKSKYNWINLKEKMPPRNLKQTDETIVVFVKAFGMAWFRAEAYYNYTTMKWHRAESGHPIKGTVAFWIPLEEKDKEIKK